ncbi:M50 family metallopeptidase [Clostridium akagii]|uniref:M50 family metallopeptidase n=1 Tax=Clostridium akagii TaxID=91623 RepID=UPI00047AE1F5|nr:M50 family metallopeptidase [Clostridium akagii]
MNIKLKPKVSKGLYYNQLYKNDKSSYIVLGNKINGVNLIIEDKNIISINLLIKEFNGNNTLEDISSKIGIEIHELISIVNLLKNKGIISLGQMGEETLTKNFNEAERFSLKIFEKSLSKIKLNPVILAKFLKGFKFIFLINAVIFFYLFAKYHNQYSIFDLIKYKESYLESYILINICMVFSFIFHEIAHLLVAQRYGAESKKFVFILYWYFIPMMYLENKNLYSLKRKDLLKVLLAGVTFNIFISLISLNIFYITNLYIFIVIALANLKMFFVNLIPLSLSDGYFVFTVLFGEPNLRKSSYRLIGNTWKRAVLKGYKKSEIIYSIVTFASTMILFTFEITWLISSLQIIKGLYLIVLIIFISLLYCIFYICLIRKRFVSKTIVDGR